MAVRRQLLDNLGRCMQGCHRLGGLWVSSMLIPLLLSHRHRCAEVTNLLKPLTAVSMTPARAAFSTTRPTMSRQLRQTTVEMRLGLSSPLEGRACIGMRSVVMSCLLGERLPGELLFAGVAGCMECRPAPRKCQCI